MSTHAMLINEKYFVFKVLCVILLCWVLITSFSKSDYCYSYLILKDSLYVKKNVYIKLLEFGKFLFLRGKKHIITYWITLPKAYIKMGPNKTFDS